jgi:hypothetical protein
MRSLKYNKSQFVSGLAITDTAELKPGSGTIRLWVVKLRCLPGMDCLVNAQVDFMICDEAFEADLSIIEPEPDIAVGLDAGREWTQNLQFQMGNLN